MLIGTSPPSAKGGGQHVKRRDEKIRKREVRKKWKRKKGRELRKKGE